MRISLIQDQPDELSNRSLLANSASLCEVELVCQLGEVGGGWVSSPQDNCDIFVGLVSEFSRSRADESTAESVGLCVTNDRMLNCESPKIGW